MIRHILFDLDNTLYAPQVGLMDELDRRIIHYFARKMGLRLPRAEQLQAEYCWQYGSCTEGILRDTDLDLGRFLADVHDIPVERYLKPNPALDALLHQLPAEKWVFTNAPVEYADRVLRILGVAGHFQDIFDIRFMDFVGKPEPTSYQRVLDAIGARGEECVMIEDSAANLAPAHELGMTTVLVASNGRASAPWADVLLLDLAALSVALQMEGDPA